jgi:hypothetical protein
MKKYKKKSIIIEAEQWFKGKKIEGVIENIAEISMPSFNDSDPEITLSPSIFYIPTLEGNMQLSEGDWVIKGIEGEFYPCKNSIFQKTYEVVE